MASMSTAPADMDAPEPDTPATHAALHTAELLENILLYLPLNDLLLSQRVCKFWKKSVEESSKAQRALFFRPTGKDCVRWESSGTYDSCTLVHCGSWYHTRECRKTTPVINPLMRRFIITEWYGKLSILHIGFVSPIFDRSAYEGEIKGDKKRIGDIGPRNVGSLEALHAKGASWRRMLFTQPACEVLNIVCAQKKEQFSISNPKGINLEDLLDGLRAHWFECPMCPTRWIVQRWDYEGFRRDELDRKQTFESALDLAKHLDSK